MSDFSVNVDLRIGHVVEVAGSAIRIELDGNISELTRTHRGKVYPIGQFGSVVKIHFGRVVLFAYVRLLRMRSELAREEGRVPVPPSEDARIIDADLFAEGTLVNEDSLEVRRGVRTYPLPGQSAYLTTQEEVRRIYQRAEQGREKDQDAGPMLHIGSYVAAEGTRCFADMNKLFGMHCAVLGSTGAGKSGTVAAVIHAVLAHRPKSDGQMLRPQIIIIDPHGEYTSAFGNRAVVYRAYTAAADSEQAKARTLQLPYWLMSAEEFREIVIGKTEYEATSENNIVYKAVTHSRLVQRGWIEPSRQWTGRADGTNDPADHRITSETLRGKVVQYDCDTPDPFSLDEFERHIRLGPNAK